LRLLFTEREKVLKSLSAFEKTAENEKFISNDILNVVVSVNKTIIRQLNGVNSF